jgi:hypothetical protein
MTTYKCSRCAGTGRLTQFSNVIGGTCFKCHGAGTQPSKPAKPGAMWAVFGFDRTTGTLARIYNVSAKTEQEAIKKAAATMARASAEYRARYAEPERAIAWTDMTNQAALTWDEATTTKENV